MTVETFSILIVDTPALMLMYFSNPCQETFIFDVKHNRADIILNAVRPPAPSFFALLTACLVRLDNEKGV